MTLVQYLAVELVHVARIPVDRLNVPPDDGTHGWREHAGNIAREWAREHPAEALELAGDPDEITWLW